VDISLMSICKRKHLAQDRRHDVVRGLHDSVAARRFIAMLAPYLSGLICKQSDFGHSAGAVGDYDRFGLPLFRTLSKIWLVARITAAAACGQWLLFASSLA
jgi:hypothetical protein